MPRGMTAGLLVRRDRRVSKSFQETSGRLRRRRSRLPALKDLAGHVMDQTLDGYLHLAAPKNAVVRSPIEDL